MTITLIWAQDQNGVIGKNNDMPWKLPADMAYFKQQTQHKTIVMGRKTWESFGSKPLPKRRNIILTRAANFTAVGGEVVHTPEQALAIASHEAELMIIGGSQIYELFVKQADRLLVTQIEHCFAGDTFFPKVNWADWKLESSVPGIRDEKNAYDYRFEQYVRS
ncbi:dihydrofolate reductase [Paenibacillus campi]|uniref:dihydrofolate reductase n=1 Tax=Paenibacillus campi TaxID=3106031 RepID=UPI002B00232B|nr:dihydrofolate reductase [Paenibacillus sp. SGZ-1014]